jgi:signal peptidase I
LRRKLVWIPLLAVGLLVVTVVVLDRVNLLVPLGQLTSEVPAMPCNGHELGEGFTYKFRDPHRGEFVVFHARGHLGGTIAPDPHSRDLAVVKRVIGVPGDVVTVRSRHVYVNGQKADDIVTEPFTSVKLGPQHYFVLGDNRSFSQDSRDFGAVPRSAIFARVVLVWWPLGHFGAPGGRQPGPPPGDVCG